MQECSIAEFVEDCTAFSSRSDPTSWYVSLAAEIIDSLTRSHREAVRQTTALIELEKGYRETERMALRRLSDALTGGNAGTWDEIFHAAEAHEQAQREAAQTIAALRVQCEALYGQKLVEAEQDIATLRTTLAAAEAHAKAVWDAGTDERVVGHWRGMAERLSEDRDIKKHALRKANEEIATLRAQLDQERTKNDQGSCGSTEGSTATPHEPPPPLRDTITGWRPIETAPKDGTRVLVYGWQYGVSLRGVGFWFRPRTVQELGGWICRTLPEQDVDGTFSDPTHWMPLPDPPAGDSAKSGTKDDAEPTRTDR